eukprot:TRINITY_DN12322_c0_g1_i1.p1 TRINITY_DN12322_c0_g1~~TRINITY_DN12322_c0_g1_i1.p1  ORF type:complete len:391 (-),score=61.23 TRINITY_DN12322_c0_g1_i1:7-1179(-)
MMRKGGSALVYGLNYPARCVAAQTHTERARFLVGTQSLTEQNQIHLIEVNEYASELRRVHMFSHPSEMWSISTSPFEANAFFTVFSNGAEMKASLWRINEDINRLQEVFQLPIPSPASIQKVVWNPSAEHSAISIDYSSIRLWDLNGPREVSSFHLPKDSARFTSGAWNPNLPDQFLAASGESITFYDVRSKKETASIKTAHYQLVRDVDINSNQPYYFVSGGDDCKVKFWDSRNTSQPLKTLAQHSHWVAQVKYNQYRDALLISSSTDWMVNLWNIPSLAFRDPTKSKSKSKSPSETPQEGSLAHSQQLLLRAQSAAIREGGKKDLHQDHLIRGYQDHEDSVYSICWSWADGENPWLFASASYDGRVIINKVPQHEIDAVTTDLENIEV